MAPFPFTFQHTEDDFFHAIGLPDDKQYNLIDKIIMYELLAPMTLEALFGIERAETDLSMSSVFERCLKRIDISNESQYITFLLAFKDAYRKSKKRLVKAIEFKDKQEDSNKKGVDIFKIKAETLEDAMDMLKSVLEVESTVKALAFLKASKCDFDKFIDFTVNDVSWSDLIPEEEKEEEKPDPKYKDIDDLLQNIMSKDEEE